MKIIKHLNAGATLQFFVGTNMPSRGYQTSHLFLGLSFALGSQLKAEANCFVLDKEPITRNSSGL